MIVATILPLMLVLIIIATIYTLGKNIGRLAFVQKLKLKWALGLYGGILLLALIFTYVLPAGESSYKTVTDSERNEAEKAGQMLVKAAYDQKNISQEKLDGVTIKHQLKLPFEGEQLKVSVEETYGPLTILVERKEANDNEIDFIEYHTKTIIENLDLTDEMDPLAVNINGELLKVLNSGFKDIKIGKFDREFTISQFTAENGFELFDDSNHVWGEHVLFLRIPEDVELIDEYEYVIYVKE